MKMEPIKFILCRPRSRSTWLAHFLGAGHDVSIFCKSKDDLLKFPIIVDTSLAIHYEELKKTFPDAKFYLLYRDHQECLESLISIGISPNNGFSQVSIAVDKLKESLPIIDFYKLDDREYLKDLYKEITGTTCTEDHLREFICTKIETIPSKFFDEVENALRS